MIISIGSEVWPFPFPLVKSEKDGKWAFDTVAGIEEIVNRRIGENELHAIETARTYVEAQRDYAAEDRDADGVLEYAQKLISSPGKTDGLYWPENQGFDVNMGGIDRGGPYGGNKYFSPYGNPRLPDAFETRATAPSLELHVATSVSSCVVPSL